MKCPCHSLRNIDYCCNKFIQGNALPSTPEELMRSRFSAYALGKIDYIVNTMKEPALVGFSLEDAKAHCENVNYKRLRIIRTWYEGKKGFVEFKAKYFFRGKMHTLHEKSEFHKIDGRWFYVDGT